MRFFSFLVALLATFLLAGSAAAQNFGVYEDSLENNWQNWSWCTTDFSSTQYVYAGQYSLEVTYTGGWQGLYLDAGYSLPADYVSDLTFWITGGTTAGRIVNVIVIANGVWLPGQNLAQFIRGRVVPANSWAPVTVPLSKFGLKPTDQIKGIVLQEVSGSAQPSFWIDNIYFIYATPPSPTEIDIDPTKVSRTVDPKNFGVNLAMWDSNLDSTQCKDLIQQTGFKAFRMPGGSASDTYNWQTDESVGDNWQWTTDFDQMADVASLAGGESFVTANYGSGTPQEAADWVYYSNKTKGYNMRYWEVGNEVYGTWEYDTHAQPNDPVTYAQQFQLYYNDMKAMDPSIHVGAVATAGEDSYVNYSIEVVTNPVTGQTHSGWTPVMLSTMAASHVKPDFIIYHRYPEYVTECDLALFGSNSGWASDISNLRMQLNDYLGPEAAKDIQIMCTENNADAGNEGKQMCSLVDGLYMADSFGSVLNTECRSYVWWDVLNGQSTTGDQSPWLYGWRPYGDEGVMSTDFTQFYPTFFMERLINDFAAAGDDVVAATSKYPLLTSYATKRSDGTLRLMILNLNPEKTISTRIVLKDYRPNVTAQCFTYGIVQDNAAKMGLPQNVAPFTLKGVGTTTQTAFPPYSATVIVLTPQK